MQNRDFGTQAYLIRRQLKGGLRRQDVNPQKQVVRVNVSQGKLRFVRKWYKSSKITPTTYICENKRRN